MKRFVVCIALLPSLLVAQVTDTVHQRYLDENHSRVGVNRHCYEFSEQTDTPSPKGYAPFYISHYGRHGSRSITKGTNKYNLLITILSQAQKDGTLTAAGEDLLNVVIESDAQYADMDGRLTERGQEEHRMLAQRMYRRFPAVFRQKSKREHKTVRAISTHVPRCLVSMAAFTNSLTSMQPDLHCDFDCGEQFQKYLNNTGGDKFLSKETTHLTDSLLDMYIPRDDAFYDFSKILTTDTLIPDKAEFINAIYSIIAITQCFDIPCDMYNWLYPRSIYRLNAETNHDNCAKWCNVRGLGEKRAPYGKIMLSDFIDKADDVIANPSSVCCDLRFGHDHPLLVLASAMHIEGVGSPLTLEQIDARWYGSREVSMASNIQVVFYRKKDKKAEILVKVLYNERESHLLGLTPINGFYYRWKDVKQLWSN